MPASPSLTTSSPRRFDAVYHMSNAFTIRAAALKSRTRQGYIQSFDGDADSLFSAAVPSTSNNSQHATYSILRCTQLTCVWQEASLISRPFSWIRSNQASCPKYAHAFGKNENGTADWLDPTDYTAERDAFPHKCWLSRSCFDAFSWLHAAKTP